MYRVLLVDDEPIAIDSLEYMLRKNRRDIEVVGKARSGRDAVEKAYNTRPDIVLMDINMPGINGLEAIRRIKETNSSAQFIITTAFDYFDYAVEAMELQATEYLLKPIREAKLLEVMEKVTAQVDAQLYGDNVFEKDGIRRDRTGDGEKTRCLCGKRGIFNRDGPAMGPQIIRQLE